MQDPTGGRPAVPGCPGRGCPPLLHPLTTSAAAAGWRGLDELDWQPEGPHVPRLAALTEEQWQKAVLDLAAFCGWRVHHETDSRRTVGGWPDLTLVRRDRLVVLELKAVHGRVSEQQRAWLHDLAAAHVEVGVAGPGDLSILSAVLRAGVELPPYVAGPSPVLSPAAAAEVDRRRAGARRAAARR